MKKLISATLAVTLLAAGAAQAAPQGPHDTRGPQNRVEQRHDARGPQTRVDQRHDVRAPAKPVQASPKWKRGDRLPVAQRGHRIDNPSRHRLSAPPRGYQWTRVNNDAILVAVASGLIAQVMVGAFH